MITGAESSCLSIQLASIGIDYKYETTKAVPENIEILLCHYFREHHTASDMQAKGFGDLDFLMTPARGLSHRVGLQCARSLAF